jgi:hypothetical protein
MGSAATQYPKLVEYVATALFFGKKKTSMMN